MTRRTERDFLGEVKVPADAYYGAQTARAIENFKISGKRFPHHLIASYAMIKRAAAAANMHTGRLDSRKGHAMLKACDEIIKEKFGEQFPLDVFQAGAGTPTNMNLNEVIANRATELLGGRKGQYIVHPNDDVNMAQSTNDTFHSAMHVSSYILCKKSLVPSLEKLQKSLEKKSKDFKSIVKSGRTHFRNAVPVTLGQEFSGYSAAVSRGIKNIQSAASGLMELNLGGTAVGTGVNAEPKYISQVYRELNRLARQKFRPAKNMFEATQNISAVLETISAMRNFSANMAKICSDLMLLSSPEFGEIDLPAVQPGSSIMPGKINPSVPEAVTMACMQVIGNDAAIAAAASRGSLELNVFMPVAAHNLMDSIILLSSACEALSKCVSGIEADKERIQKNLERNPMAAAALTPYTGYVKAAEIVKKSRETGKSVRQICLDMKLFSPKELNKLLDFSSMTKPGIMKKNK